MLTAKQQFVLRRAASVVRDRGCTDDAKLADSINGIIDSLSSPLAGSQAAPDAKAEAELLDMLGRVHPHAMPREQFHKAEDRLQRACDLQQPSPVPDQAAIVWRGDLMTLIAELQHKRAFFENYRSKPAAAQSQAAPADAETNRKISTFVYMPSWGAPIVKYSDEAAPAATAELTDEQRILVLARKLAASYPETLRTLNCDDEPTGERFVALLDRDARLARERTQ